MIYLKKFTDWILYTSVFAALCAVSLCVATERLIIHHLPVLFSPLHQFIAGSTLMVYNAHFLFKRSLPKISDRYAWTKKYRYWHFIIFFIGIFLSAINLFSLSENILIACIILGALSFTYTLPILPFNTRLRDSGLVKIITLTLVWTIVTSVLPMLYWQDSLTNFPFEIIMRFVFMFTLCIAFDIRDMQTDMNVSIRTLPNVLGLKNSYKLIHVSLLTFFILCMVQYIRYPDAGRLFGEIFIVILTKYAINYCKKYPSDKNYLGLVDGMMLLYGFVIVIASR